MNCPECHSILPYLADELDDGEIIICEDCAMTLETVFLAGGGIAFDLVEDFDDVPPDDEIEW